MVHVTKRALEHSVCPDCGQAIDTWERACATPGCGYTFNYYHWPWITVPLPPEGEPTPGQRSDSLSAAYHALQVQGTATIHHPTPRGVERGVEG